MYMHFFSYRYLKAMHGFLKGCACTVFPVLRSYSVPVTVIFRHKHACWMQNENHCQLQTCNSCAIIFCLGRKNDFSVCQRPLSGKRGFSTGCGRTQLHTADLLNAFRPYRTKSFVEISEIIIIQINIPLYQISACVNWNRSVYDDGCQKLCNLL